MPKISDMSKISCIIAISRSRKIARTGKWWMDLQILQMLIPKTLKLNIAHVYDMLWFTDPTCKIYRPEKMAGKIDWK